MSCEPEMAEALRRAGRRCTAPRLQIAAILQHRGRHLTAEEIHGELSRSAPARPVALSTVYRTLETLKQLRLASETHTGPQATFAWIEHGRPHHHLVCLACGGESTLDPTVLARFERQIEESAGFQAYLDHLAIHGLCAACREAGQ